MAEAVGGLLNDPSTKVALWAHNGHITKSRHGGSVPATGQHLRTRYGDAYYALGLLFGSGSFRARRMWPGPWPGPRAGALVTNRISAQRSQRADGSAGMAQRPASHAKSSEPAGAFCRPAEGGSARAARPSGGGLRRVGGAGSPAGGPDIRHPAVPRGFRSGRSSQVPRCHW
ncbi:erythromycin esterase family protein [Streptomyces sp. NPDC006386]|uniref:erythromycin esterase family protein n=1 Tax=Streptomyces sp. NPDC006386 TaxID=3156762 RepID=UPI0033BDF0DE